MRFLRVWWEVFLFTYLVPKNVNGNIVDWEGWIGTDWVQHGSLFGRHEHASSVPSWTSKRVKIVWNCVTVCKYDKRGVKFHDIGSVESLNKRHWLNNAKLGWLERGVTREVCPTIESSELWLWELALFTVFCGSCRYLQSLRSNL